MKKVALTTLCAFMLFSSSQLTAHCQMPCGIYHDQMIYDKIDEYYETMMKACSSMNNNKFDSVQDKNQFMRWVITKEKMSDDTADLLCTYFLMQKIKPGDDETPDLLKSVHKMLFLLVQIKQHADVKLVRDFSAEWEHFKVLFHPEEKCDVPPMTMDKPVEKTKPADKPKDTTTPKPEDTLKK